MHHQPKRLVNSSKLLNELLHNRRQAQLQPYYAEVFHTNTHILQHTVLTSPDQKLVQAESEAIPHSLCLPGLGLQAAHLQSLLQSANYQRQYASVPGHVEVMDSACAASELDSGAPVCGLLRCCGQLSSR